jgi:hypothetical protein
MYSTGMLMLPAFLDHKQGLIQACPSDPISHVWHKRLLCWGGCFPHCWLMGMLSGAPTMQKPDTGQTCVDAGCLLQDHEAQAL